MYQLRQYLCDKEILGNRRSFSTADEALEFRDKQRKMNRSLTDFAHIPESE